MSLFRAKNKILEPIWSFTMKKGSLLERLPSSDASEYSFIPMSLNSEHEVTIMVRSGYMMSGSPVSWCQADGSWAPQWSQVSCLRYLQVCFLNLEKVFPNSRSCTYPGAVIHGTINPVMFYYKVSQTVTYKCSEVIITSI